MYSSVQLHDASAVLFAHVVVGQLGDSGQSRHMQRGALDGEYWRELTTRMYLLLAHLFPESSRG
jgi:hypothetical protein